jgi:nucleoside-diphosphate-sugar epimerase
MSRFTHTAKPRQPMVLIAGGAGFLGSHLTEALLHSGVSVVVVDDFVTGKAEQLGELRKHPQFQLFEGNIHRSLPKSLTSLPITHIVQAAGIGAHPESSEVTLASVLTNGLGTKNLLDLALAKRATMVLLSSVYVYEGLASSTNLKHYYGATDEQEAQFSMFEAKRYAETLCQLYAKEYHLDVRVARLSQVYGPRMDLRGSMLGELLRMTVTGENIEVPYEGSQELHLTYISDVVYGLLRLLFAEGQKYEQVIYAFTNPEKVSVLSVAYTLKHFLPAGKDVIFLPHDPQVVTPLPSIPFDRAKQELGWEPAVKITEGLKLTVESFKAAPRDLDPHHLHRGQLSTHQDEGEETTSHPRVAVTASEEPKAPTLKYRANAVSGDKGTVATKKPSTIPHPAQPHWWRRLFFSAAAITLYVALGQPMIQMGAHAAWGGWELKSAIVSAEHLQLLAAAEQFARAEEHFSSAGDQAHRLERLGSSIGWRPQLLQRLQASLQVAKEVSGGYARLSSATEPLVAHVTSTSSPPTITAREAIDTAQAGVREAQGQLAAASNLLAGVNKHSKVAGVTSGSNADWMQRFFSKPQQVLDQQQQFLGQMTAWLDLLPDVLAIDGQKKYAILLQHTNERRPLGGVFDSLMIITVDHGRFRSVEVKEAAAVQALTVKAPPAPAVLASSTGRPTLQVRDFAWSPDGVQAGAQAMSLLEPAVGRLDGIIFASPSVLQTWLSLVGPVRLASTNSLVTAETFNEVVYQQELAWRKTQGVGPDVLGEVAGSVVQQLSQADRVVFRQFLEVVVSQLEQQQLFGQSRDQVVLTYLERMGWSGKMRQTDRDYLRVVDSNLGLNSANVAVKRQTDYQVTVNQQGLLQGQATIRWQHTDEEVGPYHNYLRVYVPRGATLVESSGFMDDQVTTRDEYGKTMFAGWVDVSSGQTHAVKLQYQLPARVGLTSQGGNYGLVWQAQVGQDREPLRVSLKPNADFRIERLIGSGHVGEDGMIHWTQHSNQDLLVGAVFSANQ